MPPGSTGRVGGSGRIRFRVAIHGDADDLLQDEVRAAGALVPGLPVDGGGHARAGEHGRLLRLGGTEAGGDDDDERSPRRRLMGTAAAALGWRPSEFWSSTPHEFWAAIEGWQAMHCVSDDDQ
ncbi:MAG: hypothetical protein DI537_34715 [Stutzerimonas stutzeri]|nr:MAG: hypothetical protein DI537_34715 [Stutzerimonas stutzeri]